MKNNNNKSQFPNQIKSLLQVNEDDEILDIPTLVDKQKGIFIFKRKLFHHDPTSRNQAGRDASTAFDFSQVIKTHTYFLNAYTRIFLRANGPW